MKPRNIMLQKYTSIMQKSERTENNTLAREPEVKSYWPFFFFFKPRLLLTEQEVEEKKHEDGWKEVTQGSAGNQHT